MLIIGSELFEVLQEWHVATQNTYLDCPWVCHPEKIAMSISWHKTRSVFDRYTIVSAARLEETGTLVVARH
jgi:hypothetical protein